MCQSRNNNWVAFYPYGSGYIDKYYLTETWSEDNRNAYFAAPHDAVYDKKNYQPQSRYLQNAAYMRLKNLTINYQLPRSLINKTGIGAARIYFSGMNLWEYTKIHKPLDPEVSTLSQTYYFQRVFTLGINLTI